MIENAMTEAWTASSTSVAPAWQTSAMPFPVKGLTTGITAVLDRHWPLIRKGRADPTGQAPGLVGDYCAGSAPDPPRGCGEGCGLEGAAAIALAINSSVPQS